MAQLDDFSKIIHSGNEIGEVLYRGKAIWRKEPDVYLAQDSDFVEVDETWVYRGIPVEVEIPTHINGELVTSTQNMFRGGTASGGRVFEATPVTKVVLRHSNVTNMRSMFNLSEATILDLSRFDISNVIDMDFMFHRCSATTGYARTQEDADKLNASFAKSTTLNFVVR